MVSPFRDATNGACRAREVNGVPHGKVKGATRAHLSAPCCRDVGDHEICTRDMAAAAARVLGRSVKVREVPLWLARASVSALRPFGSNLWELGQFFGQTRPT
jgi:hypothetical protein